MYTVVYAGDKAIMNAYKNKESPKGATLYTNLYPGCRCASTIYEAEVKEVVYLEHKREWRKRFHTGATKILFKGHVACR